MKHLVILILMCMLGLFTVQAKKDSIDYKVIVYKADGTHFEGYITTALQNYLLPRQSKVGISKTYGGEKQTYTSDEVKAIVFPPSEKDSTTVVYEAVTAMAKKSPFSKLKPSEKPVFMRLVYSGKKIKGYTAPYLDYTPGKTIDVLTYTETFYYYIIADGVAVPYWTEIGGVVPGAKKAIKHFLKAFPKVCEMIDKGEITPKEFRSNPGIVLPYMDE